jgi:hypothetical protein
MLFGLYESFAQIDAFLAINWAMLEVKTTPISNLMIVLKVALH